MAQTNIAAQEKKFHTSKETKHDPKSNLKADHALRELDRVRRWKKVHDLLRNNNKKARKEQDETIKDAKYFRDKHLIKKEKTETMGLRWGVAIPPMTWSMLIKADIIATGHSDLAAPDKEDSIDLKGSNQIVKDLEKAFPQYKVS